MADVAGAGREVNPHGTCGRCIVVARCKLDVAGISHALSPDRLELMALLICQTFYFMHTCECRNGAVTSASLCRTQSE